MKRKRAQLQSVLAVCGSVLASVVSTRFSTQYPVLILSARQNSKQRRWHCAVPATWPPGSGFDTFSREFSRILEESLWCNGPNCATEQRSDNEFARSSLWSAATWPPRSLFSKLQINYQANMNGQQGHISHRQFVAPSSDTLRASQKMRAFCNVSQLGSHSVQQSAHNDFVVCSAAFVCMRVRMRRSRRLEVGT